MIPSGVIDDIKFRCDIESVISSYVTLKRTGANLKGLCPFHSERTPSFTVYPETQSYYCFGCGAAGDVITFVMKTENLDYVGAVESLAKRAGITLPDFDGNDGRPRGVSRRRVLEMNLEAAKYYRAMLFDERIGEPGRRYLAERKLSSAAVKRFGLGYSPRDGGSMLSHLRSLGFSNEEIQTAYFAGKNDRGYYDYFRGRVMFPIIDVSGNVIAFGGRVLDDSKPKYLNTSDTPAFKKTKNLFALNYAKNAGEGYFILCEGYMDVITLHDAGFGMAVASLGTAFTEDQARIIKKYVPKVVLSYDSDEAGQKAANRAIGILEKVGIEPKVLRMSGAKDPDEYIKKFGADRFRSLISESSGKFDFAADGVKAKYDCSIPAEKIKAAAEIAQFIARVYSSVERDIYIERAAKEFSVDPASLKNDVERERKKIASDYEKKRKGELIRVTAGTNDRVNPDFARQPKAARIEEAVLGMILLHPDYLTRQPDGRRLREEDFVTALGRRFFSFVAENAENGAFQFGLLNGAFTPDEVARAAKMMAERTELSVNDGESFDVYVRALREENAKNAADMTLEDVLRMRRGKDANAQNTGSGG
ncbi:MAG: DNA primase [Clostridia bacterium]|nr:DNA primase [Clostridia bacterium]